MTTFKSPVWLALDSGEWSLISYTQGKWSYRGGRHLEGYSLQCQPSSPQYDLPLIAGSEAWSPTLRANEVTEAVIQQTWVQVSTHCWQRGEEKGDSRHQWNSCTQNTIQSMGFILYNSNVQNTNSIYYVVMIWQPDNVYRLMYNLVGIWNQFCKYTYKYKLNIFLTMRILNEYNCDNC